MAETPSTPLDHQLRSLDPRAVLIWRLEWGVLIATLLVVALGAAIFLHASAGFDILPWVGAVIAGALVCGAIVVWTVPLLEWRSWRYAIRDDEIEIHSGIWRTTRSSLPMSRIQYVDTRRGPLDRRFDLATMVIATAGGSREIPGIATDEAERLRNSIATLANIHDDL